MSDDLIDIEPLDDDIITPETKFRSKSFGTIFSSFISHDIFNLLLKHSRKITSSVLQYSWLISTSTVFVLMPIVFELKREGVVKEMEKLQVNEMLKQGVPASHLKEMGFTLEPSVLASSSGEQSIKST